VKLIDSGRTIEYDMAFRKC